MALSFRRGRKPAPRLKRGYGNPERVSARHSPIRREMELLKREYPNSLTAGGEKVTHGQATYLRRLIQPWQIRAFGYYDILGEIKYAAQFYSRSLSNLELYAAEMNDEGEIVKTENPEAIDALERIKDPGGGGRAGLLAQYGRLMFLVGEALLFVTINQQTSLEQWEMLSTDELRLLDGSYTRFMAPTLPATEFQPAPDELFEPVTDDTAVAYRLWKKHPRFSQLPDATMEGVLDLCEELVLLTQAVRARARSRLAGSGVLFLDDRISPPPDEPVPDEDPLEDPFVADLTEAMTTPIVDEGTAGAVVPLVVRCRVPDGMKLSDLVYHLQIIDPTQLYPETGLRMECIRRIAIGLDMPPEILLGMQDSNHWSAWQVDEQSWKAHLQPLAEQLVQDLTAAYYGPYLMQQGVADWEKYSIAYDATKIINHPDRGKDAKDVYGLGELSGEALRAATGFDEDDAPDEPERARFVGIKVHDSSLAWYGIPSVRQGGGLETEAGEIVSPAGDAGAPEDSTGAEVIKGPPPAANEQPTPETVIGDGRVALIEGAAYMGLLRARESAGSRARTLARRDDAALEAIDGVHAREVIAVLGRARLRELAPQMKERELVSGAHDLIIDALRMFGVDDLDVAEKIAETIENHAVRTLYERRPSPLPGNFGQYVAGLLAVGRNGDK